MSALKAYRVKIELEVLIAGESIKDATDTMENTIALWLSEPLMGLVWTDGRAFKARRARDLDHLVLEDDE